MLHRVRLWLQAHKIKNTENPLMEVKEKRVTDPTEDRQVKKQVCSQLQSNSLFPHAADCDIIGCTKVPCFVFNPDKIVSKEYKVSKKTRKKIEQS